MGERRREGAIARGLTFSEDAGADLEEIARVGTEQWGEFQATRYRHKIGRALDRIRSFPDSGEVYEPRPVFRSVKAGEHRIYYVQRETDLLVVRILHPKMDPPLHLP